MSSAGAKRKRAASVDEQESSSVFGVFASGLPYTASEDDIKKFFSGCGDIVEIRAPRYQDTGRLRGYAHVDFATKAGQQEALKKDGRYLNDRFITVEGAKEPGHSAAGKTAVARPPTCTTVFVKGLPYDADEAAVKRDMAVYGHIVSVRIARHSATKASKGFGYVQFDNGFSADAAMKAFREGSLSVGGRKVSTLDWDTGAPKGSFKGADGRNFLAKNEEAQFVKPAASSSSAAAKAAAPTGAKQGKHVPKPFANAGVGAADRDDTHRKEKKDKKEHKQQQRKPSVDDNDDEDVDSGDEAFASKKKEVAIPNPFKKSGKF